jgi:hypothetical protein
MNSQEFMEEERKAIVGKPIPNNEGERALVATIVGKFVRAQRQGRL